jgi:hypothetical protein
VYDDERVDDINASAAEWGDHCRGRLEYEHR